jgi:hypothetical protein
MSSVTTAPAWLDLGRLGRVEALSDGSTRPLTHAFAGAHPSGWLASTAGEQVLRVAFRRPTTLTRVRLVFTESSLERTQEFTLSWSSHRGETHREIVRQQFNFSPAGATREIEEYEVTLPDATWLELRIVPDIRGGDAHAAVSEFRIA